MDDVISRQNAINAFYAYPNITWTTLEVMNVLREVPSTEQKGKWIDEGQYAEGHSEHAYYCSQCEEHYIGWIGEFSFCPNCGADMRGEKE